MHEGDAMDTELNTDGGPPNPRLVAGRLLGDDFEVTGLIRSDSTRNIYRAVRGGTGFLLYEHHIDPDTIEPPEHLMIQPRESFEVDARAYLVFDDPDLETMDSLPLSGEESGLIAVLAELMSLGHGLSEAGISLIELEAADIYWTPEGPRLMGRALAKKEKDPLTPEIVLPALINRVLNRNIAPKITRNLDEPLACLCLSEELDSVLTDYLSDQNHAESLGEMLDARRAAPKARWQIAYGTDVGLVRDHNEDACGFLSSGVVTDRIDRTFHLMAVSDGMGGHSKGELAAHKSLTSWMTEVLLYLLPQAEPDFANAALMELIGRSFDRVARSVFDMGVDLAGDGMFPPGATLVAGLLLDRMLFLANSGDSRAYRLRAGRLERLTRDHSLVQMFVDRGELTAEEARGHDQSNIITTFMGIEPRAFKRDLYTYYIEPGSRLLLCSDGVSDLLSDEEIAMLLGVAENADDACERLIEAAREAGGKDNITALVAIDTATARENQS